MPSCITSFEWFFFRVYLFSALTFFCIVRLAGSAFCLFDLFYFGSDIALPFCFDAVHVQDLMTTYRVWFA